ncbi:hypothetical protein DYB37_005325 [Aphanomyces astaci]|uniref:EF-hand domain-containing protein n=1 Tax=Aphanomyces astaci TaxID=112090 RepID=A0A397C876_APHAT|nr:hypothetical protein DYB38_004347 [Aphanomyces astaci]RHY40538.1 hypothetical protein DYB30_004630 [Aphanomyces astaci]RHY65629.1 hypothetical protein DYB34_005830 [Aphanomyces astaci]RHZ11974.1 hypothetical protein DYB37_005325 [Aphanomyces astaci]
MAASKAEYRLVKAKLRTACTKRRIRLEEFMKTFDVHKTKKITADQFTRAIDASGIRLSKPEVDLLIAKYRLPDDPRSVDYRRCCDLIDKPCTTKKADKLLKQPHNKMGVAPPSLGLQPVDAEALRSVKDKLATAIRTKGIVLKDVFHDFDKNNSGVVTKARFVRDLSAVVGGDLSLREVDAITKAYGSGPLDVHYKQLHADLQVFPSSSLDNDSNNDSPRPRRRVSNQGSGNDVDAVEAPLRAIVARDRIRMKNFFTDYDRLRAGKCTDGQFQRAVKVCFGALTEKDLLILVAAYSVPSEDPSHERKVDYVAFCKSVSSLVQDRDDANDELHVDVAPLPTAPCTRDTRGDLTDAEAASWTDLMTRLSHTVATRRILLKPLFCDFDRGKTECVSCEQFARVWIVHVLAMFNMFLTSADEKQAILKRYASTRLNSLPPSHLSFDNKAFVNFKTFCLDLDEFQRRDAAASTSSCPVSSSASPLSGHVAKVHFAAGLNAAGFVLSNVDVEILANEFKYAVETERDVDGAALVAWTRFADEIDAVFTVKGLERDPTRDIRHSIEAAEQTDAIVDTVLAPDDEAAVVAAMQGMATFIQHQRLDIRPPFEDFDLSNQGFVSASKFNRVLSIFNLLPANAATARLLTVKFSERGNAPHLGVSSTCDVNYRAFLSALANLAPGRDDATTTVLPGAREFRLRQSHTEGDPLTTEAWRRHAKPAHAVAVESLLKDIRLQTDTKRIRLKQFFTESDRLRSGDISVAKFHTAISRSGLHVDANDILTLNSAFQSTTKPDLINYRAFVLAVESTAHVEDCRDHVVLSKPSEALETLLGRIRTAVDVKSYLRLHIKPFFEDYDRNCLMHVSKTQFASVLDMMQLGCTPQEISLLTSTYCVRHGREDNPDVNYLRFIQDVDQVYSHLKHPIGVKAAVKPIVK